MIYEVPSGRADFTLAPSEKKSSHSKHHAKQGQARPSTPRQHRHSRHDTREASDGILRKLIVIALLLGLGVFGYRKFQDFRATDAAAASAPPANAIAKPSAPPAQSYRCDGRTHCSQMRSCADATQVLKHCPGTAMDGDGDGVPCETQWCN